MKLKSLLSTTILCGLLPTLCYGWGGNGHRIVGAIAASYLTEEARNAVTDLLGEETLATASTWADEIKSDESYNWAFRLHFINLPRDSEKVDLARDCVDGDCVVAAINKYSGILADAHAGKEKRIEALRFLVHFIGDIHQPMHVSYADNLGGNTVKVSWFGKTDDTGPFGDFKWNLHGVWDFGFISQRTGKDWVALAIRIRSDINDIQLIDWSSTRNPLDWANESYYITRQIYSQLPEDKVLGQDFYEKNIATVETRLAAAGVRLAALLNRSFSGAATAVLQPSTE